MTASARLAAAVALATVVVLASFGGAAWAAWNIPGAGQGTAQAATLVAPIVTAGQAQASPSTVIAVSWTDPGQLTGVAYSVTRNGVPVPGCSSSPCTDSSLSPGTSYTYVVTASRNSWSRSGTATQSTQAAAVASKFLVSVVGTPQAGVSNEVRITAQTSTGATATGYTGPKSITWSGTAAANSPLGSAATFSSASFSNGVATVQANFKNAGTSLGLTAAEGAVTGSTTTDVTAGSATALALTSVNTDQSTSATTCFQDCSFTGLGGNGYATAAVSLLDAYGNWAKAQADQTVTLTKTGDGVLTPASLTVARGAGTTSAAFKLSESGNWTAGAVTASIGAMKIAVTVRK